MDKKSNVGLNEAEIRAKHSEEVQVLLEKLNKQDSYLNEYKNAHGKLEVLFRALAGAITPVEPLPTDYKSHKETTVASLCTAVAHISDGHHGAIQDPDEIEGFGEFSPEISRRRQVSYAHNIVDWVSVHRHAYKIDDIAVIVTGDLISGDIHEELKTTNAFPAPVQAIEAAKVLAEQLYIFAPHFKTVTVHFIVEDNHSRLTKKPQAKEAGMNTYNYVVGWHAKELLKLHKNVTFNIYPMNEKVVHVSTRQYLITHGHAVRGWMGVPWYGVERKVAREAVARMQVVMEDLQKAKSVGFHKYIFGHWHTPVDMPLYSCAGSVSGTDAYDHQAGRYAKPSQPAWIVHPKHGEFDRTNFWLE